MPLGQTTNPLLQQTEQSIKAKIQPQFLPQFQLILTNALKLLYSSSLHQRMAQGIQTSPNPEQNAAQGAANIVGLALNQDPTKRQVQAIVPAAMVIMCEILDFIGQTGKAQITPQLIAQCTEDTGAATLKMLNISQDQMHQVVAKGLAQRDKMQGAAPMQQQAQQPAQTGGIIGSAMKGAR